MLLTEVKKNRKVHSKIIKKIIKTKYWVRDDREILGMLTREAGGRHYYNIR